MLRTALKSLVFQMLVHLPDAPLTLQLQHRDCLPVDQDFREGAMCGVAIEDLLEGVGFEPAVDLPTAVSRLLRLPLHQARLGYLLGTGWLSRRAE
jgi:hypothetical protein